MSAPWYRQGEYDSTAIADPDAADYGRFDTAVWSTWDDFAKANNLRYYLRVEVFSPAVSTLLFRWITWQESFFSPSQVMNESECLTDVTFPEYSQELKTGTFSFTVGNVSAATLQTILTISPGSAFFQGTITVGWFVEGNNTAASDWSDYFALGYLDAIRIDDSGDNTSVTFDFVDEFAFWDKPAERTYTPDDQKNMEQKYPSLYNNTVNDRGFDYVSQIPTWTGYWGKYKESPQKNATKKPTSARRHK